MTPFYHRLNLTPRRLLLGLVLALVCAAGLWVFRTTGATLEPARVRVLLLELGAWGSLALIAALSAVLILPLIPATVLQIGAGLAFGPAAGLVCVVLADLIGASAGFVLARRFGRTWLDRYLSGRTRRILAHLARRMSWRMVMLLRLLPGPAYPLVSFAAGYSPLPYWQYILASLAGVLPALVLLVLAGDLVTRSPLLAFGLVVLIVAGLALAGRLLGVANLPNEPEE